MTNDSELKLVKITIHSTTSSTCKWTLNLLWSNIDLCTIQCLSTYFHMWNTEQNIMWRKMYA